MMKGEHVKQRELRKVCWLRRIILSDTGKKEVMDMLHKHEDAFSLRDEIGTYQNIEVEMDVRDKSPFVIRPYHAIEEDKAVLYWEMQRLCYQGNIEEDWSANSSSVLFKRRKVTKHKRSVTNIRCMNVRRAKNNLACPLLKDTFLTVREL